MKNEPLTFCLIDNYRCNIATILDEIKVFTQYPKNNIEKLHNWDPTTM